MIAFIIRRLLGAVLLLFVISAVTFAIFFLLPRLAGMTTDQLAARFAGKSPDHATLVAIEQRYGFTKPVPVQYYNFMHDMILGGSYNTGAQVIHCDVPCFGYSFRTNLPVRQMLINAAPTTFSLAFGAAVMWLFGGLLIGILSALRKGSAFDRFSMGLALAGVSLPIFFTGLVANAYLVVKWHVLPAPGEHSLFTDPAGWFSGYLLPWITLALLYAAMYARLSRAGMLDTMAEDYMRTARAKGLPERTVILKHALRATLTPILTVFGLDLGLLLGGAVLTEKVFSFHGLGAMSIDGVVGSDLPVVLGVTMLAALFVVLANLVVDILYAVVDPRVRLS